MRSVGKLSLTDVTLNKKLLCKLKEKHELRKTVATVCFLNIKETLLYTCIMIKQSTNHL